MFFNQIATQVFNRQINFVSDYFYSRLVTAAPSLTLSTVSQLTTETTGGNYAAKIIASSNPTIITSNNSAYISSLGSSTWLALTNNASAIVGVVVCKSVSQGVFASADLLIAYIPFTDTPNSPSGRFTPDASDLILDFSNINGLIKISTV